MTDHADIYKLIPVQTHSDSRGDLFVIEDEEIAFPIRRIFYFSTKGRDAERGHHAHKKLIQGFIAMHGVYDVCLHDGHVEHIVTLSSPGQCLVVQAGIWVVIKSKSDEGLCAVMASAPYDEDDYIRDWALFLQSKNPS